MYKKQQINNNNLKLKTMKNYKDLNAEVKEEFINFFNKVTIGDCEDKDVDFVKVFKAFKAITQEQR